MITPLNSSCLQLLKGFTTKLQNFQSIRFRKPIWMPRAKSKMFKVPPRPVIPIEETLELQRLHNNYRCHVKSIRNYLELHWKEKTEETIDRDAQNQQFEEDFKTSLLLNEKWCGQLQPLRESFFENELKAKLDFEINKMEEKKAQQQAALCKVEDMVRVVKSDSKNFIMPENIDENIDKLLENETNFNYALNLKGKKIV